MCFKNLPVEFDQNGTARLREGVADPYSVTAAPPSGGYVRRRQGPGAKLAAPPRLRDWNIDPMTRVAGALAVHTVLDLENHRAVEAHSRAMLFRGYEVILQGRDPRDAIDISSRACGVCGGTHAHPCHRLGTGHRAGIRDLPAAAGGGGAQPGRGGGDVLRPPAAPRASRRAGLLHRTGLGHQPRARDPGGEHARAPWRHPWLHDHQGHHGRHESPHGEALPGGPGVDPGGADHVQPHVRQVSAPLDAGAGRDVHHHLHDVVQRVLHAAGQDRRLVQGGPSHLGRPLRPLPGGQPGLRAGRRSSHQPGADRDLGRLRELRRQLCQRRRLAQPPLGQAGCHRRRPAAPPRPARDGAVLARPPDAQRPRAQPRPGLRPGLHGRHRHELPAAVLRVLAAGRDKGSHALPDPQGRTDGRRILGGEPRIPHPPSAHGQGQADQLPDLHPSTWNAAPRDPFGVPGPYEEAVLDTPILESVSDDQVKGIDVLRTIRSFDPCMPCTTHMDTGRGVIVREVNSCGCTLE